MGTLIAGLGAVRQGGVPEAVSGDGMVPGTSLTEIMRDFQRARDNLHSARQRLEENAARGPGAWAARRRYRRALHRLSHAGKRLVQASVTDPGLPASAMHRL